MTQEQLDRILYAGRLRIQGMTYREIGEALNVCTHRGMTLANKGERFINFGPMGDSALKDSCPDQCRPTPYKKPVAEEVEKGEG
jgi:hypothetical protein